MRTLKRLAIGVTFIAAVLLIVNATPGWQANQRLENKRAALRAAGIPASIAELAPKPLADEANAAVHLERIKQRLAAFAKQYAAFYESAPGNTWSQRQDAGQLPTPEQAAAMRAILDAYPDILSAFQRAAECDGYASRLDFTLHFRRFLPSIMERQSDIRMLARFIDWKATLSIADGQADEAVRLGTQLMKVARLYENEPTLVNYLISIAVRGVAVDVLNRAIRSGSITDSILDQTRERLLAELDAQDRPALKNALKTEWAIVLDYDPEPEGPPPQGWQIPNWMLGEGGLLDMAIEGADRPYFEARDQWGEAQKVDDGQMTLRPAIRAAFQAEARRLALVRSLRILLALSTYRQRTGQEANGLDDLGLPQAAVVDPHSGKPLKLKRTDEGWVVYSVMENGVDDGGDFTALKDWGLAPPGYRK